MQKRASRRHLLSLSAPLVAVLAVTGCSTAKFSVGHVMVPVLNNARDAAMASDDLRTFQDGAAANLFLMEGLIRTDPKNDDLRLNAAMLYFSYAFSSFEETEPAYASRLYLKGVDHARAALRDNRKLAADWSVPFDEFEASLAAMKKKDVPAAVWAAANWAQFIAIHLDSTAVLRDIPKVTALLERSAELDGAYFQGLPHVMIGSLHAFRPPMFGGSPEKSLASFEQAFDIAEESFLLPRYFFARYYLYRVQDGDEFRSVLADVVAAPGAAEDPYRLLNLIARQRSQTLLGEADDLF
ncbi:MAG TPA: TRAP transporter TatT component family protein [Candidatus Krumholzibacteria bacterium]|nr:TRAP transporter TatT component family protein [Candidatus Krumholzibacteria bacterium]